MRFFSDSIDHASKVGVKYVAQAGGSVADAEVPSHTYILIDEEFMYQLRTLCFIYQVIAACGEYGMTMAFTGLRLFHH